MTRVGKGAEGWGRGMLTVEGGKAVLKVSGARARVAGGVRARVPESARMG